MKRLEPQSEFGWILAGLMWRHGLNLRALATETGNDPRTLSNWINFNPPMRSIDAVKRIGTVFEPMQPGSLDILLVTAGFAAESHKVLRNTVIEEVSRAVGESEEHLLSDHPHRIEEKAEEAALAALGTLEQTEKPALFRPKDAKEVLKGLPDIRLDLYEGRHFEALRKLQVMETTLRQPRHRTAPAELALSLVYRERVLAQIEALGKQKLGVAAHTARRAETLSNELEKGEIARRFWLQAVAQLSLLNCERVAANAGPLTNHSALVQENIGERLGETDMDPLLTSFDEQPEETIWLLLEKQKAWMVVATHTRSRKAIHLFDRASDDALLKATVHASKVKNSDSSKKGDLLLALAYEAKARGLANISQSSEDQADALAFLASSQAASRRAGLRLVEYMAEMTAARIWIPKLRKEAYNLDVRGFVDDLIRRAPTNHQADSARGLAQQLGVEGFGRA